MDGQGAVDPFRSVGGRDRRDRARARPGGRRPRRGRVPLPRDDDRHERSARAPRRRDRPDRDRGVHRPARDRPSGPRPPVQAVRRPAAAAGAARAADRRPRAHRAGSGRRRAHRGGVRARRRAPARARLRERGHLPAVQLRRSAPRAPARRGDKGGAAGVARERLLRGPAPLPGVRALLDHRHRRLSGPAVGSLPAAAREPLRSARPAPAVGDAVLGWHCRAR